MTLSQDRPPVLSRLRNPLPLAVVLWLVATAAPAGEDAAPTYTKDVAPILQQNCQECHRKGQIAPFGLETYDQARKRAADIADVAERRVMPPWKPEPGVGPGFQHDRSLSAQEIETLVAWSDAGAPEGKPEDLPPAPEFSEGWKLGQPDLILSPAEAYAVAASGPDVYRCFVIPTNLPADVAIRAIEYRPGNPRVVHHISTFIDTRGFGRHCDAQDPGPGYTSFAGPGFEVYGELGFWNAGSLPQPLPEGVGFQLPRGADVILQVHYHPSGKPETDQTELGLYLSREPIRQAMHWNDASNHQFTLKAGDANAEVAGSWYVPVDLQAHAVAPHMHNLGRDIRMSVTYPDGKTRDLIHIPRWDPGWQSTYYFAEPIALPAGSTVKVLAHFDNSAENPRNPHSPPRAIPSGYAVDNEMCVGYIAVTKAGQNLALPDARDDLHEIFERQRMKNLRKALRRR